jgi:aerobic-type carbon monoxide dehydrogenase small subunit (CoxS/CutS family)
MMTPVKQVVLNVNGRDEPISVRPHHNLVDALRSAGLSSVREACGVGMCGACTVLVDGEPVSGCLVLAEAAVGARIETLEGQTPHGDLSKVQQAFLDHSAFQCSFCTPGFVLTATRLVEEHPNATDDEIVEYLSGNLCRCGSYVKILDAVRSLVR